MENPSILDHLKEKIRALVKSGNPAQSAQPPQDDNASAPVLGADALPQLEIITPAAETAQPAPNVTRVDIRAEIPVGTTLHFSITAEAGGGVTVKEKTLSPAVSTGTSAAAQTTATIRAPWQLGAWLTWLRQKQEWVFGGAALLISLLLIAWKLENFPIYFFGDEAYQVLIAETLIKNNFVAANSQGIPIYVEAAGNRWTPVISMYFHAITMLLFGKSIIVTRLTTGIVGMAGIIATGFALKEIFKSRFWWLTTLAAVSMPAWLLHSRTGFETVMATGFYGFFIFFYLLYRYRSPKYIFGALVAGAAVFYSYSNAQAIIAAAGLLLFLIDIKYHWANRGWIVRGLVLAVVLAIPFLLFRFKEPGAIAEHMRTVNSFVVQDIPFSQKLVLYFQKYLYGLSPQYWFIPNTHDLVRHRMDGMGQIATWMLPFFAIGLVLSLVKVREAAYRTILIAAMAVPAGAAVLEITITRVLPYVVPASILVILGLDWLAARFANKTPALVVSAVGFSVFALAGILTLNTAFTKGPYWVSDYGLYGMQYGAKQIFVDTLPKYLRDPNARIYMSSTWANGADNFVRFFLPQADQSRVQMSNISDFIDNFRAIDPGNYFVLTAPEYDRAVQSGRFKQIEVIETINYPNDMPGFYVVQLEYVDGVQAIIAAEQEEKRKPVTGSVVIDGVETQITYSRIDMGQPKDIFDGDFYTLMRGAEANPYILELAFSEPRIITGLVLDLATMDYEVVVSLYAPGDETPTVYTARKEQVTTDAHIEMTFNNPPSSVERMTLSILNLRTGDFANVHLRELDLLP